MKTEVLRSSKNLCSKWLVLTGISAWKEQILGMEWYLIQRMLREVDIQVFEGRKAGSKCKVMCGTICQIRSVEWKKRQARAPLWRGGWSALRKLISMIQEHWQTRKEEWWTYMRHRQLWRIDVSKEQGGDESWTLTDRASHMRKAGSQCANNNRGFSYGAIDYFCPNWGSKSWKQTRFKRLVNAGKEEGILGAEVGWNGNMKVRQGYWKWIFGMWRVLKAKCAKKSCYWYSWVTDFFGVAESWAGVEVLW